MNKKIFIALIGVVGVIALASSSASAVTAGPSASTTIARMTRIVDRANQEIERRLTRLNELSSRISELKKISASDKAVLASDLEGQITEMNNLRAKIGGDKDLASLRVDVQSITKNYRIFALVIPRAALVAWADRVVAIADQMSALQSQLQSRLGENASMAEAAMTDMSAKLSDVKVKAQAAIDGVSKLTPDNGDKTRMASNLAALKAARSKIQEAHQDLVAARKDIGSIMGTIRTIEGTATSTGQSKTDQ